MVLNATFNNISVLSWRSVLLVEETEVSGENQRPVASPWHTLSHNVVSSALRFDIDICVLKYNADKFNTVFICRIIEFNYPIKRVWSAINNITAFLVAKKYVDGRSYRNLRLSSLLINRRHLIWCARRVFAITLIASKHFQSKKLAKGRFIDAKWVIINPIEWQPVEWPKVKG